MAAPRNRDLISGPILSTLVLFSAPTLVSNILQSLNGSINSIWVGRLLGEGALAATANANVVMFLVFSVAFGFGMAATIRIGQSFGAGNVLAARRTFGSAIGFSMIIALVVGTMGWVFSPELLTAMAAPGETYIYALTYLRIIFLAMPASMITIILSMGLRGGGDAATPLKFMIFSSVLDIGLNPVLINGFGPIPPLGIAGSAMATAIATTLSMIGIVAYVYVKDLPLRLRGAELKWLWPRRDELVYMLTKGLPMGGQMLVSTASSMIVIGLVNREGIMVSAAYGATLQLWTYLQMPAMAVSSSVSAMAAQAIGAGLSDRLSKISRWGIVLNLLVTGTLCALILLFDRSALELFLGESSPAVDEARHIQFLASWSYVIFGVTMVLFGTMRAGGVVWTPLIIFTLAFYPVRLGFYYAFYPVLGADALWLAFPISSAFALALSIYAYRKPGWREQARAVPDEECEEESHVDAEAAGRMTPTM